MNTATSSQQWTCAIGSFQTHSSEYTTHLLRLASRPNMAGTLLVFRTEYHLRCSDWLSDSVDSLEFVMSKTVNIIVILQRVMQYTVSS